VGGAVQGHGVLAQALLLALEVGGAGALAARVGGGATAALSSASRMRAACTGSPFRRRKTARWASASMASVR